MKNLDVFLNKYVSIVSKTYIKMTMFSETEETMKEVPVVTEGYLTNYDEDYYFLGNKKGEISKAIRIAETIDLEIVAPPSTLKTPREEKMQENEEQILSGLTGNKPKKNSEVH